MIQWVTDFSTSSNNCSMLQCPIYLISAIGLPSLSKTHIDLYYLVDMYFTFYQFAVMREYPYYYSKICDTGKNILLFKLFKYCIAELALVGIGLTSSVCIVLDSKYY